MTAEVARTGWPVHAHIRSVCNAPQAPAQAVPHLQGRREAAAIASLEVELGMCFPPMRARLASLKVLYCGGISTSAPCSRSSMVSICIRGLLAQPARAEVETVWCGALNGLCVRSVPLPSTLALCTSECVAVIMRPLVCTAHLHAGRISLQRHNTLIYQHMARRAS